MTAIRALIGGAGVKAVQNVTCTIPVAGGALTNDQTITAVDLNNAAVEWAGNQSASILSNVRSRVALQDATTVRATRGANNGSGANNIVKAIVTEFQPGSIRSIQTGSITMNGTATSGTATISAVSSKAKYYYGGCSISGGTIDDQSTDAALSLTNSTTLTVNRAAGNASNVHITNYTVVDFI